MAAARLAALAAALLMRWADGTHSIRDGNHRCIGGRLRGDATILAHVIDETWPQACSY